MQKEQLKPEEVELEEIAPLTLQNFEEFYASSGGHQSCLDIAAHDNFIKIQPDQLVEYLKNSGQCPEWVVTGYSQTVNPSLDKEITISSTGPLVKSRAKSLEESWVYVEENSIEANNWVKKNTRSLFDDWHSFGVYEKMADYTKTSFLFGYAVGSASVINAMTNFYLKYPGIAWSATALTAIFAQVSPVVLTAVKYIVLGGVLSGSAMAAPIFVIGTSGVFVSATVYHSFQLAKKLATEPKNLIQQ